MDLWIKASIFLCLCGFFKAMKPSEPFLTPYLKAPPINLTEEQLDNQVYPVWTYAYMVSLFVLLLITDFLRYKPIIICEGFAYLATRIFLIWGRGLTDMQVMQVAYGIATGSEIAYYSYLYALVQPEHFRKVTSITRAAVLFGRMTSGVLGQLLISLHITGYLELYYISLVNVCIALILSFMLPSIKNDVLKLEDNERSNDYHGNSFQGNGCQGSDVDKGNQKEKGIHTDDCDSIEYCQQGHGFHSVDCQGQDGGRQEENDLQTNGCHGKNMHGDSHQQGYSCHNNCYQERTIDNLVQRYRCQGDHHDNYIINCHDNNHHSNCYGSCRNVSTSIVDKRNGNISIDEPKQSNCCFDCFASWKQSALDIWHALKECYSNTELLKWSLWWAIGTCGDNQVENYASNLWDIIYPSHVHKTVYNGGVDASAQFVCTFIALFLGYWKVNWSVFGELFLGIVGVCDCAILYISARASNIWMAYLMYILFRISYTFVFVIASFQIAKNVKMTRYALVFGCNTFLSLVLQSILTFIVVDERGLNLDAVTQFVVYGLYFYILGAALLGKSVYTITSLGWKNCWRQRYVQDVEPEMKTKYQTIS